MAPKVVTDVDEAELARQMDELEQANEEVAGDSASDEDDDDDSEEEEDDGEGGVIKTSKKKGVDLDDDPKIKALSGLLADSSLAAGAEDNDDNEKWDDN